MNETLSADAITIYEEVQTYEPVSLTGEAAENLYSFPRLDGEVMPLVAANEHVIASCRWMGGAEVTLTIAMINYPELMTEENADQILADIREFLASQRIEREILDEELDAEEEDAPEKERPEPEEKAAKPEKQPVRKAETDNKIKNEIEVREFQSEEQTADSASHPAAEGQKIEPIEVVKSLSEESFGSLNGRQASIKTAAYKNESIKPASITVEAGVATDNSAGPRNEDSPGDPAPLEIMPEPSVDTEVLVVWQMPVLESSETGLAVATTLEAEPAPAGLRPDEEQKDEYLNTVEVAEASVEPEPVKRSALGLEDIFIMDDEVELTAEEIEASSEAPTLEIFDYTTEAESNFVFEVEGLLGNPGLTPEQSEPAIRVEFIEDEVGTREEVPPVRQYNELLHVGQMETANSEQPVQITLPIAEAEASLTRLAEHIEESEPEEIEAAEEILDRIIEVITKPDSIEGDDHFTEEEARNKLEELFTELFQITGTVYTPDLIESLAYFTVQIPLSEELEKLQDIDRVTNTNKDRATHEIIKELLVCMNTSRKVMTSAWAIGKSALRLYSFSF